MPLTLQPTFLSARSPTPNLTLTLTLTSTFIPTPAGEVVGLEWVVEAVGNSVLPQMAACFELQRDMLEVEDLFIARYTVEGQTSLAEHEDGSPWSFVLTLNEGFQGGGTTFPLVDGAPTVLPAVGRSS